MRDGFQDSLFARLAASQDIADPNIIGQRVYSISCQGGVYEIGSSSNVVSNTLHNKTSFMQPFSFNVDEVECLEKKFNSCLSVADRKRLVDPFGGPGLVSTYEDVLSLFADDFVLDKEITSKIISSDYSVHCFNTYIKENEEDFDDLDDAEILESNKLKIGLSVTVYPHINTNLKTLEVYDLLSKAIFEADVSLNFLKDASEDTFGSVEDYSDDDDDFDDSKTVNNALSVEKPDYGGSLVLNLFKQARILIGDTDNKECLCTVPEMGSFKSPLFTVSTESAYFMVPIMNSYANFVNDYIKEHYS